MFMCLLFAMLLLSSCSKEEGVSAGYGYIRPNLIIQGADAPPESAFQLTLTAADGRAFKCKSISELAKEALLVDRYSLEAHSGAMDDEGYNKPYYCGSASFNLKAGGVETPEVKCTRRNVAVTVKTEESFSSMMDDYIVRLHAVGGSYLEYDFAESGPLYLRDGLMELLLEFRLKDGRSASVIATSVKSQQGDNISFSLSAQDDALIIKSNKGESKVMLTDELFSTDAPSIAPVGFVSDAGITINEGVAPEQQIGMKISSFAPLSKVVLTVQVPELEAKGIKEEIDLLNASATIIDALKTAGFEFALSADGKEFNINYNKVLAKLRSAANNTPQVFSLIAVDRLNQVSSPLSLMMRVLPLVPKVVKMHRVTYGVMEGSADIYIPIRSALDNLSIAIAESGHKWREAPILKIEDTSTPNVYKVTFKLTEVQESSLNIRFSYLGNPFATQTVIFNSPSYTISVDAFAHHAVVRVNASDANTRAMITKILQVYVNGSQTYAYSRNTEEGTLKIMDLYADRTYSFKATIFDEPRPDDFTPSVTVTTESVQEIKNSDFEERKEDIKYEGLPQGGAYSQSAMPLFNRQNHADIRVKVPKYPWATVNAKTFYREALTPNTWYMQPSAMESSNIISGTSSVRLVSVAFDPAGEQIAPYRQLSTPYLNYNPNVPRIRYRAAGKLFLGEYSYSPSAGEKYLEGVKFSSRPRAINGIYRYTPGSNSPADCGRVDVKIIGRVGGVQKVIASASGLLYPSVTNTNFSIPIEYKYFGAKAEALCVMVSSSKDIGDIATESANIKTMPDLPLSTSTGSVLEVDNISLSY